MSYTVLNNNDSGVGSLRDGIILSNNTCGIFTISIPSTILSPIILLSPLIINKVELTINGDNIVLMSDGILRNNNHSRIIVVNDRNTFLTLNNIIIQNGVIHGEVDDYTYGAAICIYSGHLVMNNCRVEKCNTDIGTGAIATLLGTTCKLNDCTIQNNTQLKTGGLYAYTCEVEINNCVFKNNNATSGNGGGINMDSVRHCIINNTLFDNNSASNGGGIYGLFPTTGYFPTNGIFGNITNSLFINNRSTKYTVNDQCGTAIYAIGNYKICNCTITNNIGIAVYLSCYNFNNDNLLTDNTIVNNDIGMKYSSFPKIIISNNIVTNNNVYDTIGNFYSLGGNVIWNSLDLITPLSDDDFNPPVIDTKNTKGITGETILDTLNIKSGIRGYLMAKYVYSDTHHLKNYWGDYVPFVYNIISGQYCSYVVIPADFVSVGVPDQDLFVTSDHEVLYGDIVRAGSIPGLKIVNLPVQPLYSICMEEPDLILANNMPIMAHDN
jgi:trimeric autotransporter adhesin